MSSTRSRAEEGFEGDEPRRDQKEGEEGWVGAEGCWV